MTCITGIKSKSRVATTTLSDDLSDEMPFPASHLHNSLVVDLFFIDQIFYPLGMVFIELWGADLGIIVRSTVLDFHWVERRVEDKTAVLTAFKRQGAPGNLLGGLLCHHYKILEDRFVIPHKKCMQLVTGTDGAGNPSIHFVSPNSFLVHQSIVFSIPLSRS